MLLPWLQNGKQFIQKNRLSLTQETDRIYINTNHDIHLFDPGFSRSITIKKQNSLSTIVWNPWQDNSLQMNDMADDAWLSMLCIEAANVQSNEVLLHPGQTQQLVTIIDVNHEV
ncbi:MAG: hypothetical protein KZQ64_02970 [gamma proteobacterium symbiont of Bathyaustriella thionipta]|nr:hypothetical protein [gamma proteobacterium symbiont of Bathyaustriella thionipta]MCU7950273.1 hypothetical protein [gamma proteobacterium symbiont of Bathyaustriella thionipta]MCU7952347.1 hypothetical protein [gamma proteobacterium symbiont of Bathyaustriella thionipta]MCU7956790.1 hypothetical protein [gamma proteobacterium symbiont of Bathyaustriella thionipta]MCU7968305.1 hypothetical protein [gamma proteobacterium symbiont of Bathyaustriella thionipta]